MNADHRQPQRQSLDDAHLDALIDAVAREMTEGEPSSALRARVLERIEQGQRPPATVPRWAWAGAAATVLLAVATAIWMARPWPDPGSLRSTVAGQQSVTPSLAPAGATSQARLSAGSAGDMSGMADRIPAGPQRGRGPAARSVRPAELDATGDLREVPALAEIEPLRFSAVGPDPLQIAAVNVAALPAMPSIDIPSLGPGSDDIPSADPKKEK